MNRGINDEWRSARAQATEDLNRRAFEDNPPTYAPGLEEAEASYRRLHPEPEPVEDERTDADQPPGPRYRYTQGGPDGSV